jgi:hypothetical protein
MPPKWAALGLRFWLLFHLDLASNCRVHPSLAPRAVRAQRFDVDGTLGRKPKLGPPSSSLHSKTRKSENRVFSTFPRRHGPTTSTLLRRLHWLFKAAVPRPLLARQHNCGFVSHLALLRCLSLAIANHHLHPQGHCSTTRHR